MTQQVISLLQVCFSHSCFVGSYYARDSLRLQQIASYCVADLRKSVSFADGISDEAASSSQHASSPARSAANIGKLGPCPSFDASLTNEQIKPYVLEVLETTQQSRSPLDLSKTLWPEASTDVRHSMKVRVSQPLHALRKVVKYALQMHCKLKLNQRCWRTYTHNLQRPTPSSVHCSCAKVSED